MRFTVDRPVADTVGPCPANEADARSPTRPRGPRGRWCRRRRKVDSTLAAAQEASHPRPVLRTADRTHSARQRRHWHRVHVHPCLADGARFYAISFSYHPRRLMRLIMNVFSRKQETKVDRVVREFINKDPDRPGSRTSSALA